MKFIPFPEFKTERLLLRQVQDSDCGAILFLRSDPTVNKFIERPEFRQTKNEADALNFIREIEEEQENDESVSWGITLHGNPEIIGTICLWNFSTDQKTAEVGYNLMPPFYRKGIMSEAIKLVIDYGFKQLNLEKIEAYTHFKNENSTKLLEKTGFHLIPDRKDEDDANNLIFEIKRA